MRYSKHELIALLTTTQEDTEYNSEITPSKMSTAIKCMRNSALGPDLMHVEMLKKSHHISRKSVDLIHKQNMERLQTTMRLEISPHITDKKTRQKQIWSSKLATNITLTNVLCKLMELVITLRLHQYLSKNHLYGKYQSGFTPKRSILDNLTRFSQEIIDGFNNNEISAWVFFDVEKGFWSN